VKEDKEMKTLGLTALGFAVATAFAVRSAAQAVPSAPQPTVQRDPQALILLGQSLALMTKTGPIQDVRLQAQVTRTAGSDSDTGSATLEAASYDKSNIHLALTSGALGETHNGPAGVWSAADAQNRPVATHNCWTAAAWFAPALVIQAWVQDPSFTLAYAGLEDRDGVKVHHVHASRAGSADIVALSAMDLYLDPQSLLPLVLAFNTHPDDDLGVDLPVQVTFASYQIFGGFLAPSRIQEYLQNSLLLDFSVTAAGANNGLAATGFLLP
jgi:hypothetical protein